MLPIDSIAKPLAEATDASDYGSGYSINCRLKQNPALMSGVELTLKNFQLIAVLLSIGEIPVAETIKSKGRATDQKCSWSVDDEEANF